MSSSLSKCRVAILAMDNFEQAELTGPKQALEQAGAKTDIISAKPGTITGMKHDQKADRFQVDKTFGEARPEDYDAVVLPGGVFNADQIRTQDGARQFVQKMVEQDKPLAVICHAPWLLVSAGLVRGKTLTSWPSLQDDLRNAGAQWVDREVVVDGRLITSRKPDDIPAFNEQLIKMLEAA